MKNNTLPEIASLPQPPVGSVFSFQKVEKLSIPHPYCITPKHVAWASDHFSGRLSEDAIRGAEKNGAQCDICAKSGRGILTFDQHENSVTLFVKVPQNQDLNSITNLRSFLYNNKAAFETAGIQGFAFPTK